MFRAWSRRRASWRSTWIIPARRLARSGLRRLHRGSATPCFVVDERMDRWVVAAQRAGLVLAELQLSEAHVLAFEQEVAADHGLSDVEEVLERLERHHAADDPGQDPEHACFGAALDRPRRRLLGEQAAGDTGRVPGVDQALE